MPTAMLSPEQFDYLCAWTGFKPNLLAKPKDEFYRLKSFKGWKDSSKTFMKHYLAFRRLPGIDESSWITYGEKLEGGAAGRTSASAAEV